VYLFRFLSVTDLRAARVSAGGTMINTPAHGFAYEGGRLFVRLPGSVSPNGRSVLFSSPTWGETGTRDVVRVTGSPYVILDGFRIEGSGTFCAGFGAESIFPTVRNTILEYCRYGLQLPNNSLVEWTEYTYPGFRDFAEAVRVANANTMRVYDLMKVYHPGAIEGGLADTYGPSGTAHNAEFRYNYLHQTFDGESLGDFEDSESHHNVYDSNYDDHVEMESWADRPARNLRLHDSLFLSVGLISHQSDTMVGPQYVYRNVVYSNDVHGASKWTIIKSKAPNATGGIFYYHNVLWGQTSELFWQEESRAHLYFRNNLIVFQENYNSQTATPLNSDYNLLVNNISKPFLFGPSGAYVGTNPASLGFLNASALNFGISGASPAVNRGVSLPGFNDGAPGGPDVGAFEAGVNPGTEWPRPRRTAYTPFPPERWNGALPPGAPTNLRVIR
jgi:hypothetical protein